MKEEYGEGCQFSPEYFENILKQLIRMTKDPDRKKALRRAKKRLSQSVGSEISPEECFKLGQLLEKHLSEEQEELESSLTKTSNQDLQVGAALNSGGSLQKRKSSPNRDGFKHQLRALQSIELTE